MYCDTEEAQLALGGMLARHADTPLTVHLVGDLGTGKTTLVRGFLRALGYEGAVRSPTFTLVEPYDFLDPPVYHLDLYRLGDPEELEYLGARELLTEAAWRFIEWPQRGAGWLPRPDLEIEIRHHGNGRKLQFRAHTPAAWRAIGHLRQGKT